MSCFRAAFLLAALVTTAPVFAQSQHRTHTGSFRSTAERWVRQLANDLDHLQEDLYYERGNYPRGLRQEVDRLSRSVAHFQMVLRESDDPQHLRRDFREMDGQIHRLVNRLDESGDPWLRRQASRLNYSDEQLHYALEIRERRGFSRELLARHIGILADEAQDLRELARRVAPRDDNLRKTLGQFNDEIAHFQEMIERRGDGRHLREDFERLDDAWRRAVDQLNDGSNAYYLRSAAHNVDRVVNQIDELLYDARGAREHVSGPENPPPLPRPQRDRPALQFEIPGIGRFVIPQ